MSGSVGGGVSGEVSGVVGVNEEKKKKVVLMSVFVGFFRNGVSYLRGTAKDYVLSVVVYFVVE